MAGLPLPGQGVAPVMQLALPDGGFGPARCAMDMVPESYSVFTALPGDSPPALVPAGFSTAASCRKGMVGLAAAHTLHS